MNNSEEFSKNKYCLTCSKPISEEESKSSHQTHETTTLIGAIQKMSEETKPKLEEIQKSLEEKKKYLTKIKLQQEKSEEQMKIEEDRVKKTFEFLSKTLEQKKINFKQEIDEETKKKINEIKEKQKKAQERKEKLTMALTNYSKYKESTSTTNTNKIEKLEMLLQIRQLKQIVSDKNAFQIQEQEKEKKMFTVERKIDILDSFEIYGLTDKEIELTLPEELFALRRFNIKVGIHSADNPLDDDQIQLTGILEGPNDYYKKLDQWQQDVENTQYYEIKKFRFEIEGEYTFALRIGDHEYKRQSIQVQPKRYELCTWDTVNASNTSNQDYTVLNDGKTLKKANNDSYITIMRTKKTYKEGEVEVQIHIDELPQSAKSESNFHIGIAGTTCSWSSCWLQSNKSIYLNGSQLNKGDDLIIRIDFPKKKIVFEVNEKVVKNENLPYEEIYFAAAIRSVGGQVSFID
ncbi:bonus [Anaeramoeba flamelloides]|uniref:Bonus n=1 Tax=Anaeramoeba flamelloides TaxID=1746091 RepID=A0ABQ8YAZ5_9EUKA|nr:bonus [Anaeramoeba flamelloides]